MNYFITCCDPHLTVLTFKVLLFKNGKCLYFFFYSFVVISEVQGFRSISVELFSIPVATYKMHKCVVAVGFIIYTRRRRVFK